MKKLNNHDTRNTILLLILILLFNFFTKDKIKIKLHNSDIIAFLSIITGFLLSALAILYASPLRQVLYDKDGNGYESRWEQIIIRYSYLFTYCLVFIWILLIDINMQQWILLSILSHILILIGIIANQLFTLLLREVND